MDWEELAKVLSPEQLAKMKSDYAKVHSLAEGANAAKAKLAELEKEKEEAQAASLKKQQKFEELYNKEKEKVNSQAKQLEGLVKQRQTDLKKSALREQLGVPVKDAFLGLADLDSVLIGDDGNIVKDSVVEVASGFKSEYPEIFSKPSPGHNPSAQPPVNDGDTMIDIDKLAKEDPDGFRSLLSETLRKE